MRLINIVLLFSFCLNILDISAQVVDTTGIFTGTASIRKLTFTPLKQSVKISWIGGSEKNLKQYNFYRSIDNQNFFVVGEMPAKNKEYETFYEFIDRSANDGINYYKLFLIDTANKAKYLQSIVLEMEDWSQKIDMVVKSDYYQVHLSGSEQLFEIELKMVDELNRSYPVSFIRDNTHEFTVISQPLDHGVYFLTCFINKKFYSRKKIGF